MIISIHQPHFFPWLGYFHKIIQSDAFVYLDNVQYRKNYFQNRTQIKDTNGKASWLTIPVQNATLETPINKIKIAPVFQSNKLVNTLRMNYGKAPFFKVHSQQIFDIITGNHSTINDINHASIKTILDLLDIRIPSYIASELQLENDDPNGRILEICKKLNADTYLAGKGGKNYMDLNLFQENNIKVDWQKFEVEKYKYPQINGDFIPGISVIDSIFNIGAGDTKKLLLL